MTMTERDRRRALRQRARERYGLLLVSIISAFAVQGIAEPGPWQQVIVTLLLGTTVVLALWAMESRPAVTRPVVGVAAILVVVSIVAAAAGTVDGWASRLANLLLVTLAPPAIILGVVRSMRARRQVTVEAVFGVLCLYILLGMAFSFLYGAIDRWGPGFFANNASATVSNCLYYSFTTLTTIGYGDLTAAGNLGHTLSVFEGLLGQIYLVTIVSLIVGNLGRGRQTEE